MSVWLNLISVFWTCLLELPTIVLIFFKTSLLFFFLSFFNFLWIFSGLVSVLSIPFARFSFCLFFIIFGFLTTFGGFGFFFFSIFSFGFFLINEAISLISFSFFKIEFFFSIIFLLAKVVVGFFYYFLLYFFLFLFLLIFLSLYFQILKKF